jgi:pilus assembly protein Flp/PilA
MRFLHFIQDESGVTALEYGTIASLIAVATLGATTNAGQALAASFLTLGTAVMSVVLGPV